MCVMSSCVQALSSNPGYSGGLYTVALKANGLLDMLDNPDARTKAYPYNVFGYTDMVRTWSRDEGSSIVVWVGHAVRLKYMHEFLL
jgi:hypothetical protein